MNKTYGTKPCYPWLPCYTKAGRFDTECTEHTERNRVSSWKKFTLFCKWSWYWFSKPCYPWLPCY